MSGCTKITNSLPFFLYLGKTLKNILKNNSSINISKAEIVFIYCIQVFNIWECLLLKIHINLGERHKRPLINFYKMYNSFDYRSLMGIPCLFSSSIFQVITSLLWGRGYFVLTLYICPSHGIQSHFPKEQQIKATWNLFSAFTYFFKSW